MGDPARAVLFADDRTFNDWFRTLEKAAGVEHQPGRAWYGLRRLNTDLAEDREHDERVLNDITGHVDSATRRRHYQERERPKIRRRTAQLRHQLQTEVLSDSGPGGDDEEAA